jgi:hypothetical protein
MSFQDPDHRLRQSAAAAAKQAMLQNFRAASEDPDVARRHAARVARGRAATVRFWAATGLRLTSKLRSATGVWSGATPL